MPWIDNRTKTIRDISGSIVGSYKDYDDKNTWWFSARPNKNKKYKYPLNLKVQSKGK